MTPVPIFPAHAATCSSMTDNAEKAILDDMVGRQILPNG
jgi:hypothetical protein